MGTSTLAPVHVPVSAAPALGRAQFERIRKLIYDVCGLTLPPGKESLVQTRLSRRLRALGFAGYDEYLAHLALDHDGSELSHLVDALTTNKTSFFRDAAHFTYLRDALLPAHRAGRLRIWSAGCSSGEEPYSVAILLHEAWPDIALRDVRVLATDVSTAMLRLAREAVYGEEALRDVPVPLRVRYFTAIPGSGPAAGRRYRVNDQVRALVRLARLNLMADWPVRGPFDAIFCRNVMIYFDRPTRERLVQRFLKLLGPGGHLFVGLSESLTSLEHGLRYVQPAVYAKPR
jgi:chemotaxis protein methyltransferase CheR